MGGKGAKAKTVNATNTEAVFFGVDGPPGARGRGRSEKEVTIDLQIQNLPENDADPNTTDELDPGALILFNATQTTPLNIIFDPKSKPGGKLTLTVEFGQHLISIWDDQNKTTQLISPIEIGNDVRAPINRTVYLSSFVSISEKAKNIVIKLSYSKGGSDSVKLTVIERMFISFQNSRGMTSHREVSDFKRIGTTIKDGFGDTILFRANIIPNIDIPSESITWSIDNSGLRGKDVSKTFNKFGDKFITVLINNTLISAGNTVSVEDIPTPNETNWALEHILETALYGLTLSADINEAIEWADTLRTLSEMRRKASRHAYGQAISIIDDVPSETVASLGLAHERTNIERNDRHNESVMDLDNNYKGRLLGLTLKPFNPDRETVRDAVLRELSSGGFIIIDREVTTQETPIYPNNNDESGLLMQSN